MKTWFFQWAIGMMVAGYTLSAQQQVSQTIPRATLRLAVFDPWGKRLDTAEIELWSIDRKRNLVSLPTTRTITSVPYDRYILRARIPGYISERQILVNAREMFFLVAIPFRWGDSEWEGGFLQVRGNILPSPTEPTFVRVRGIYLDDQREAQVSKSGEFSVGGLDNGAYVIEVFTGVRLLHAETIDLDQKEPVRSLIIKLDQTRVR